MVYMCYLNELPCMASKYNYIVAFIWLLYTLFRVVYFP